MRTHAEILSAVGAVKIATDLGLPIFTVRSWRQRDSIPDAHWKWLADKKLATLDELATHAAARKAA